MSESLAANVCRLSLTRRPARCIEPRGHPGRRCTQQLPEFGDPSSDWERSSVHSHSSGLHTSQPGHPSGSQSSLCSTRVSLGVPDFTSRQCRWPASASMTSLKIYAAASGADWLRLRWLAIIRLLVPIVLVAGALWGQGRFRKLPGTQHCAVVGLQRGLPLPGRTVKGQSASRRKGLKADDDRHLTPTRLQPWVLTLNPRSTSPGRHIVSAFFLTDCGAGGRGRGSCGTWGRVMWSRSVSAPCV